MFTIMFTFSGFVQGNIINSTDHHLYSDIGKTIILSCSYSTSSNAPYLFWYRQYPQQMQYILSRGGKSQSSLKFDNTEMEPGKFQSETNNTHTTLTIHRLSVLDSAVYLCALRDGAQYCRCAQLHY
uniref:Ig-like domain-containing protein n=1 Tax=Pyxicephalus adspersus TaxID=30357 RepID=A0AAV3A0I6_PYXAD|nr:TPA: hypothetical protein GDO54_013660 [Pyxicephalus adspersus]